MYVDFFRVQNIEYFLRGNYSSLAIKLCNPQDTKLKQQPNVIIHLEYFKIRSLDISFTKNVTLYSKTKLLKGLPELLIRV